MDVPGMAQFQQVILYLEHGVTEYDYRSTEKQYRQHLGDLLDGRHDQSAGCDRTDDQSFILRKH